jgi:CubicO group peptidase (beta-lactamase class C family)
MSLRIIAAPSMVSFLLLFTAAEPFAAMPPDLDVYLGKAIADWDVPGLAVAIVQNDTVVAIKGYGVRELGKSDPVDGETIFEVASLTKSFTAAGAAVLVDEGRISWDERVRDRLPEVVFGNPYIDATVTLRDLLCHRTGLQAANTLFRHTGYDRSEVLSRVRYLKSFVPFRSEMFYNNVLYTVAGEMTAKAAGLGWAELIRTRLVEPAGMRSTTVEKRPRGRNVAKPHAWIGDRHVPIRSFDYTPVGPASSIYTNARDMTRWLRLQLNEGTLEGRTIISRSSMTEMHTPHTIIRTTPEMRAARQVEHYPGYGLGWQVVDYRSERLLWHTGSADGFPCYMALLPNQELGFVILMNSANAYMLHLALASRIIDAFLGFPPRDYSAEALARRNSMYASDLERRKIVKERKAKGADPGRKLSDYVGLFRSDLWGDVNVREERGALTFQIARGDVADLTPWSLDTFLATWRDPLFRDAYYESYVVFRGNPAERVSGLTIVFGRDTVDVIRRPE